MKTIKKQKETNMIRLMILRNRDASLVFDLRVDTLSKDTAEQRNKTVIINAIASLWGYQAGNIAPKVLKDLEKVHDALLKTGKLHRLGYTYRLLDSNNF